MASDISMVSHSRRPSRMKRVSKLGRHSSMKKRLQSRVSRTGSGQQQQATRKLTGTASPNEDTVTPTLSSNTKKKSSSGREDISEEDEDDSNEDEVHELDEVTKKILDNPLNKNRRQTTINLLKAPKFSLAITSVVKEESDSQSTSKQNESSRESKVSGITGFQKLLKEGPESSIDLSSSINTDLAPLLQKSQTNDQHHSVSPTKQKKRYGDMMQSRRQTLAVPENSIFGIAIDSKTKEKKLNKPPPRRLKSRISRADGKRDSSMSKNPEVQGFIEKFRKSKMMTLPEEKEFHRYENMIPDILSEAAGETNDGDGDVKKRKKKKKKRGDEPPEHRELQIVKPNQYFYEVEHQNQVIEMEVDFGSGKQNQPPMTQQKKKELTAAH